MGGCGVRESESCEVRRGEADGDGAGEIRRLEIDADFCNDADNAEDADEDTGVERTGLAERDDGEGDGSEMGGTFANEWSDEDDDGEGNDVPITIFALTSSPSPRRTVFTRAANCIACRVSDTLFSSGLTQTNINVFVFPFIPPSESANRCVSFELRTGT